MLGMLNVSQSGLNAARIAVENVSNNIANENTPGYKKRVVQLNELEQIDSRFSGRGVSATGTYRVTSQYMYDKLISENSKSNYYDKLSNMLDNVESIFTETLDSGFSSDLNRYFQSIENLRTNPNSEIYKSTLKNEANILVESLTNLYSSVEKQQSAEKSNLYTNVDKINSILTEIGVVNEKLVKYDTLSNDLLDKRDQLELELSDYVDISVNHENGYYELKIAGEAAISNNTNVRKIELNEEQIKQVDKFILENSNTEVSSINFTDNKFDDEDVLVYKLNNEFEVSVKFGEEILDANGDKVDLGDGTNIVSGENYTRALVYKINTNADTKNLVTAYNGSYIVDENGLKSTKDYKDNYLRIESLSGGLDAAFDGRIYVEEHPALTYSKYSPQEGDIISLENVINNSDLSLALQDINKFTNNGNGTYTATANAGEVRLVDGESIQKTFIDGEIIIAASFQPDSDLGKALIDTDKFTPNGDGTYTATALAGTVKIDMNESITIDKPVSISFSIGDVIDINDATINPGSTLSTYLADTAVFQELSPGSGLYKALVPSDGSRNDTLGNPVTNINLERNEFISRLNIEALDVGVPNIPVGSIIKADPLSGSSLSDLLTDTSKFTDNLDGTFTIKLSNGSIPQSDFKLTGSENISITLSQELSLPNNFSYAAPANYDSSMVTNMELDGIPVLWDSINGVVTDISSNTISLTDNATLTFDVTGIVGGNKVDIKAGDIVTINEDPSNGTLLSEGILSSGNWVDNGDGTYIAIENQTLTLDDALDQIGVTRNINVSNSQIKVQDGPGSEKIERVDITTAIDFDEIASTGTVVRNTTFRNEDESADAESKISMEIYEKEVTLNSGIIKAQIDNLSSDSYNNKFQDYLDKLDSFAQTLSDISDKYIKNGSNDYTYGDTASDGSSGTSKSVGLFNGSSVKSLKFNENIVNDLTQEKLDYLATIQWKGDLSFDEMGQDSNSTSSTSLVEFFRDLRVNVASDNENNNFLKETHKNVKESLQSSYDQLTKVDKDDEMINLIKFQAAYTANAKLVTIIDEMLQTLLGMKR